MIKIDHDGLNSTKTQHSSWQCILFNNLKKLKIKKLKNLKKLKKIL